MSALAITQARHVACTAAMLYGQRRLLRDGYGLQELYYGYPTLIVLFMDYRSVRCNRI